MPADTFERELTDLRPATVFAISALATTILDRLMHRSVLVEFKGRSYRLKHAASRLAKANDSE